MMYISVCVCIRMPCTSICIFVEMNGVCGVHIYVVCIYIYVCVCSLCVDGVCGVYVFVQYVMYSALCDVCVFVYMARMYACTVCM